MAKFTKKAKIVDAVQWKGDNFTAIQKMAGALNCHLDDDGGLIVKSFRGSLFISRGSYVVIEEKDDDPITMSEFRFKLLYSPKK